jgi:hypothetical protein
MLRYTAIIITLLALLTSGCWYGTFMSPRAVGTGKVRIRVAGELPAYVNSHDREKDNAKGPGPEGKEVTPGFGDAFVNGMVTYGAAERFDIGLQGNLYSVGIHAKWWAHVVPEYRDKGMDFAPILFLYYIFDTQRIAPKLSLVGGLPISRIAEAYIGYEGFYGPQMNRIDDVLAGRIDFVDIEKQELYQDNLFIGVDFNFKDIGFTTEIGYPINRNDRDKSTAIWFGIGAYYGELLKGLL